MENREIITTEVSEENMEIYMSYDEYWRYND